MADWFKVKVGHCFHSDFTARQKAAWIDIMALTTLIEKAPTDRQLKQLCGAKVLSSLDQLLINEGSSVHQVVIKVLEDVEKVKKERDRKKAQMQGKYENPPRKIVGASDVERGERGDKKERGRRGSNSPTPFSSNPTEKEIAIYIIREKLNVDSYKFFDYYEKNNWKDKGGNPIADWKKKLKTWSEVDNKEQGIVSDEDFLKMVKGE